MNTSLHGAEVGPKIVLCMADVGCGHARAAAAVALALRERWSGVRSPVIDALDGAPRWFTAVYRGAYLAAARHTPAMSGWFYKATDTDGIPAQRGLGPAVEARAMSHFTAMDAVRDADVIVCTHFLCARVLSRLRGAGRLRGRLVVVVTDQHPHAVWRVAHADRFLVASESARNEMIRHGVAAERVVVTGIPIDGRFARPMSREAARASQGLAGTSPVILLCGGGLGLGGMDRALEGLIAAGSGSHVVVVCGRNADLRMQLSRRVREAGVTARIRIAGQTSRMRELMAAADLMVGKPGGLTTAEAAAVGLPMVLLRPIPGQEERNAAVFVKQGAAVLEPDAFRAGVLAARLVTDKDEMSRMREAARGFGRSGAAGAAAEAVMGLMRRDALEGKSEQAIVVCKREARGAAIA